MSHRLPRVVPADDPDTYLAGGLLLIVKYAVPVTIECAACKTTRIRLKLLTHSEVSKTRGDELVSTYLAGQGWVRAGINQADVCPECANTAHDICPHCRLYTGGHTRDCPTQIPGAL